jgi:hypothetical protein
MDKELDTLLSNYKHCLQELTEIYTKAAKVNSSEQVIANHTAKTENNDQVPEDSNKKLNQIISKLKLDVDTVINKRLAEANASKLAVQIYLDNTIWELFSRTELQNNTLLFNNDQHRTTDKKCLIKLISTMINMDRETQIQYAEPLEEEEDAFLKQLHQWMTQITSIYLRICTVHDRKKILQLLISTSNISTWAIPLIQVDVQDITSADDYIAILDMILFNNNSNNQATWTEDDFLAALDQLAVDYNYNKMLESIGPDDPPNMVFKLSQRIIDALMNAIERFSQMKTLIKRLSQTVIQISVLLVDSIAEKGWTCQDQIDTFISQLIYRFYDLKDNGWFFLPNIPFKVLSINQLWDVTAHLLQIKSSDTRPSSLAQVLDAHLPNVTRFQYELHDNQTQGFFMLSCLTNIATCIPSGVDDIGAINDPENALSSCIVTVISYTLFTVAFIDKNLREMFYKDVRDNFGPICKCHSFIISLLFRWSVEHIAVMERMALYLFHSLRLDNWTILNDDLKLLHKLLSSPAGSSTAMTTQQKAQIQLAKYVIEHLNYGYKRDFIDTNISKSQPWHNRKVPFLSYDIHEEIAFILLDACQQFQPLPDAPTNSNENKGAIELVGTVTNAVSTYLPIADQIQLLKSAYIPNGNATGSNKENSINTGNMANDFIHWAWSVAIRLKLYDCPISPRASDIEGSITLPFLRLVLNSFNPVSSSHSALLIYISFMLSVTSRHFLRFTSNDGWMKLLTILKRGKPEATILILGEIIPSFVYMHGDDFFNDDSLSDFLRHAIELKHDPALTKAAKHLAKNQKQVINDINTTGIGRVIASHIWQAHLIDEVSDLMDESGKGFSYVDLVMHSWLKTVFRRSDWMWHSSYVAIVNTICKLAFTLRRYRLVYHMLMGEHKRMEAHKLQTTTDSPRLTRFIKNMMASDGAFASLLIGEWSLLNLKQNTFSKAPGIELQLHWFSFEALVLETLLEGSVRQELIQVIIKQLSNTDDPKADSFLDAVSIYKSLSSAKKPIEYLTIYRWLSHILVMPMDHPLLVLYLQMFFSLYYQCIDLNHHVTLGSLLFSRKSELITKLRDYIANVQTYFGQKMTDVNSGHTAEVLQQLYYAMWLWLGNADLVDLKIDLQDLPSHYDTDRLTMCFAKSEEEQPWHQLDRYWTDLVDVDQLEQDFLSYPWEGSEKFRTDHDDASSYQPSMSIVEDLVSLSTTTTRRFRLITDESTIVPLPPVAINEPKSKSTSSSLRKN